MSPDGAVFKWYVRELLQLPAVPCFFTGGIAVPKQDGCRKAVIPVFISFAGCPHRCIFCNQRVINGESENSLRAAEEQIARAEAWVLPGAANELAFYGGSFTALPLDRQRALLSLAEGRRRKGLFGRIRLSTRPDAITPEILEQLQEFGVETVELGVQSLDDRVLALAERGHTAADVERAASLLRRYGFRIGFQLMVGLPGETEDSLRLTRDRVLSLAPDLCRIYPLLVLSGTKLAQLWEAGAYAPLSLEQAVSRTAYFHQAFTAAGIRVIRMGLQPDRDLCAPGHILAGPFHPAFGELVLSHEYRTRIESLIEAQPPGNYNMIITCPDRLASVLRGQHRCNVEAWEAGGRIRVVFRQGEKVGVDFHDR